MTRIALVSVGMHGHVNPTLGFTEELVRRGHTVDYYGDPAFTPVITKTGAHFIPYDTRLGAMVAERSQMQLAGKDPWAGAGQNSFIDRFVDELEATYGQLAEAFKASKPDVVVYDFISVAARLAAEQQGIPAVQFFTSYAANEQFDLGKVFHGGKSDPMQASPAAAARLQAFAAAHGVAAPIDVNFMRHTEASNLVFMPKSFQLEHALFDERFYFVGPCVSQHRGGEDAPEPAGSDPLVLVSLGTIFNAWPNFYRDCISALGSRPLRVVMATGPYVAAESLGAVPPSMRLMPHVPQLAYLKKAAVFVSHGGMNSTMEALAAGVPLVSIPQMPEQEVTARRLAELGLGLYLKKDDVSAETLAAAVATVQADEGMHRRLALMKSEIAAAGGSARAASVIEATAASPRRPSVAGPSRTDRTRAAEAEAP